MFLKGVSRRWLINSIGITLIILIVFITAMSFTIQSYTYNSINQVLTGRVNELLNVFSSTAGGAMTPSDFAATSRDYIENFPDKNQMEIMSISRRGEVLATSTGFAPDRGQSMPDYQSALQSADNAGYWSGFLGTGEKAMAITRVVRDDDGNVLGSLRYIVSMERADRQIFIIITSLILAGLFIMLVIILSGIYFLRSIVVPIRQVSDTARQIAHGDFDVRIESPRNRGDEIAQLCESINDMAGELGASEQMKNDFISSVSHELRTPLTSIKGWAETLREGADTSTSERGMNVIIRESERLSGIVEELLDFSKLQSGRMKLSLRDLDISSELGDVVYMFTERAYSEHKDLSYRDNPDLPHVMGDSDKLRQVFINIMDNAFKYSGTGGTVSIDAAEKDGFIEVSISDTGCGIPEEHLQNVTKKFYKANQIARGSGIGLAVVDEIVSLHHGSLSISSEEGKGTTVIVALPSVKYLEAHPEIKQESSFEHKLNEDTSKFPKITEEDLEKTKLFDKIKPEE